VNSAEVRNSVHEPAEFLHDIGLVVVPVFYIPVPTYCIRFQLPLLGAMLQFFSALAVYSQTQFDDYEFPAI
jgi:hypothetical protein